jgi:hypothetical protein
MRRLRQEKGPCEYGYDGPEVPEPRTTQATLMETCRGRSRQRGEGKGGGNGREAGKEKRAESDIHAVTGFTRITRTASDVPEPCASRATLTETCRGRSESSKTFAGEPTGGLNWRVRHRVDYPTNQMRYHDRITAADRLLYMGRVGACLEARG